MKKTLTISALLLAFSIVLWSQEDSTATNTNTTTTTQTSTRAAKPKTVNLKEGTILEQWDLMIDKSSSWENYKVVKKTLISQFRKNLTDSLAENKTKQKALNATISNRDNQITNNQKSITDLNNQLSQSKSEINSVNLLGNLVSKSTYNTIMWSIVLVLLLLCGILFILFKRSNTITRETKEMLTYTQEEFEAHRKTALRREQKLARELHNEKNKFRS